MPYGVHTMRLGKCCQLKFWTKSCMALNSRKSHKTYIHAYTWHTRHRQATCCFANIQIRITAAEYGAVSRFHNCSSSLWCDALWWGCFDVFKGGRSVGLPVCLFFRILHSHMNCSKLWLLSQIMSSTCRVICRSICQFVSHSSAYPC